MKFSRFRICHLAVLIAAGLAALTGDTVQASILGWGDRTVGNNDSDADMILVATGAASQTLPAGTYQATNFNFQFTQAQTTIGGSVRPLIMTSPSTDNYTVIAMGNVISYSTPTSFASIAFGGTDTFTLATTTQVFGAFYWDGSSGQRNPIGFNGGGGTFLRYAGAAAPALNTSISGGFPLASGRAYDFSIDISAVPEPSGLVLVGGSALGLFAVVRRRRLARRQRGGDLQSEIFNEFPAV